MLDVLQPSGANLILLSADSPEADIDPFAKQGVPAFGLLQDGRTYFNYHHTAADTLDKIVPLELRENAAAMAVMGYALAAMPDPSAAVVTTNHVGTGAPPVLVERSSTGF